VLFVSESITLAQIVRLVVLARALDPARYELHFAASRFPEFVFAGLPAQRWPLYGLEPERALRRLDRGRRLYTGRVLARYIAADRALLERVKPDLVVGDLRWSLAVSAPLCGVPCASLINAYWSPYAARQGFPLPDHPIVRWLGEELAARYFPRAIPRVFAHFIAPLNAQRRRHGLPPLAGLLELLTWGEHTLYCDPPELVPVSGLPATHAFLGPVLWSAPGEPPPDWGRDPARPAVYVTLGSSGDVGRIGAVLEALAGLRVDALLATAGRARLGPLPSHVRAVEYVDGAAACARARVVVHNGGSSTGYQALAAGRPVVGIPHNFDQYLASERIDAAGAGLHVPARRLSAAALRAALERALEEPSFASAAQDVAKAMARHDAARSFAAFAQRALG
jgi:UDP:flavonoid glycosyltransferase YjiC (YdhE family)